MSLVTLVAVYLVLTVMPYFFVTISGHRITVDLSYPMDKNVMKWITMRDYEIKITNGTRNYGDKAIWFQSDEVAFATHTGTHLDAPIHFGGKNKWRVNDIPLKNLVERPLCLVDIVDQSQATRDYVATVDDLKQFEEVHGEIPEESVVIFRTGWSNFWPNKLDYFGTDTKDPTFAHFPGIDGDAAKWLVEARKVVGVGIDGPSIDCGQCGHKQAMPAHVTLNEANVYILENIERSIFKVPNAGATITVLPLKLVDASGSPVRAIAQYTHGNHDTNWCSTLQPSLALFLLAAILATTLY